MNEQNRIDQRTQSLLNGSVDGELSAVEQTELDELIARSDEVRVLHTELKELSSVLNNVPDREPPEYLQNAIVANVRLPVDTKNNEKRGFFATWLPAHWLPTGIAVAAGAVLTIGIYELGTSPLTPEDAANMVGTVVQSRAPERGELLDSAEIDTDILNGVVELRSRDGFLVLDVQLNSDGPTNVNVEFAGRGLEFEGITRMQDIQDTVSVVNGSVNVASSGEQHYALKLRNIEGEPGQHTAPLKVEFFADKRLVHMAELNTSRY
jgi:hypothetical protein